MKSDGQSLGEGKRCEVRTFAFTAETRRGGAATRPAADGKRLRFLLH